MVPSASLRRSLPRALGPTLRTRSVILAIAACGFGLCAALLLADAPAPAETAGGQVLGNFSVSGAADPPANFSEKANAFRAGGALYVEKLEFFHNPGTVPPVKLTKDEGGVAVVHVWAHRPLVQLASTKCEFARTVRFAIPTTLLVGVKRVLIVNHDTESRQLLFENEELASLLREPEPASAAAAWKEPLPVSGNGCGA